MTAAPILYGYAARIVYVVDGDTVDLVIDLGFTTTRTERVRFLGIDAPERSDEPGYSQAKTYVAELKDRLDAGQSLLFIRSYRDKKDSFGRYLATLYEVDTATGAWPNTVTDINAEMLERTLAVPYVR